MNRRLFISQALRATAAAALAASAVASSAAMAETAQPQKLRLPTRGPKRPGSIAAQPGGGGQNTAYEHDSDEQLDVWVKRCNDAGGGMSTGSDGNYDCKDSSGNSIPDW